MGAIGIRKRTLEQAKRLLEQAKTAGQVIPLDHAFSHHVKTSQIVDVLRDYRIGYANPNPRTGEERYLLERDLLARGSFRTLRLVIELRAEPPQAAVVSAHWRGEH